MKPEQAARELYNISPDNDIYKIGITQVTKPTGKKPFSFLIGHIGHFDTLVEVYGESFIRFMIGPNWSKGKRIVHISKSFEEAKEVVTSMTEYGLSNVLLDGRFASREDYKRVLEERKSAKKAAKNSAKIAAAADPGIASALDAAVDAAIKDPVSSSGSVPATSSTVYDADTMLNSFNEDTKKALVAMSAEEVSELVDGLCAIIKDTDSYEIDTNNVKGILEGLKDNPNTKIGRQFWTRILRDNNEFAKKFHTKNSQLVLQTIKG